MSRSKQFLSDNAAAVHPRVWDAMRAADEADAPYDGDALSQQLDARFADLFGRECAVLWTATGTSANCLALAALCPPHGGVVCHREAHIEMDEAGAPGFYLHGAKLLLAEGEGAKLTPDAIRAVIDPIRDDVHQVQPHAISLTQASEYGRCYRPEELAAIGALAQERGLGLHVDGARFGNAVAFLGCLPAEAVGPASSRTAGWGLRQSFSSTPRWPMLRAIAASAPGICRARAATSQRNCWRCSRVICGSTTRAPPMPPPPRSPGLAASG
jgi:threonine aldolase